MLPMPAPQKSPHQIYAEHCEKGELAYQVEVDTGKAVFHPRVVAPGSGSTALDWKISGGRGTVHATTVVFEKGQPSHNVCLVDLDEGYRMMSRVEGVPPLDVAIGLRVQARFAPGDDGQPPYPVFVPLGEAA